MNPDWIAADWGTTYLRLWAMAGTRVLDRRTVAQGMGRLVPAEFGPVLETALAGWGTAPVVACGMVGSRQGWCAAPYTTAPCPLRSAWVRVEGHSARAVYIACGIKQMDPPDVMRGEETQIAGLLARDPGFEGTICLPGTHTKWVALKDGVVSRFHSCMSGEIFDLLAHHSVLRHMLDTSASDLPAFDEAVMEALNDPAAAYGQLFALRAGALVADLSPVRAAARLSGLLVGWELAATRGMWRDGPLALIGSATLSPLYARALAAQSVPVEAHSVETVTLAGLAALWSAIETTT